MRFGVLRNISGNIEALKDADRLFDESGVDVKVCLGQIVGMYPWVDECVKFLVSQRYAAMQSMVEHEFVSGCQFLGWSTIYLNEAVRFARGHASVETVGFFETLPSRHEINGVEFEGLAKVKGSFIYNSQEAAEAFVSWKHPIVVHAANFEPCVWHEDLSQKSLVSGLNQLAANGRLLISTGGAGSIYQGSRYQPDALVLDDKRRTVHVFHPKCDVEKIFDQLRQMGYPREPLDFLERHEYEAWRKTDVHKAAESARNGTLIQKLKKRLQSSFGRHSQE